MANSNKSDLFVPKAGSVPRKIADKLKQGRKKLLELHVPDDVHISDLKNADWKSGDAYLDLAQWNGEIIAQTAQLSGVTTLWLLEFLTRALNSLAIDNFALRGIERGAANVKVTKLNKNSKWSRFKHFISGGIKKHPTILAYVSYYAFMNLLIFGGVQTARAMFQSDEKDDKNKKEVVKENTAKTKVVKSADKNWWNEVKDWAADLFGSDERILKYVDPKTPNYVENALDAYWPEIAVGLTELETYRATPKVHSGEKRMTNGLGCTWFYSVGANGKIIQSENVKGQTRTLTTDENYEQCKLHLKHETLKKLQDVTEGKKNIRAQHAIALVYAGYQRTADMQGIAKRLEKAKSVQEVADAFAYYRGAEKWRVGTLKRRWVCAAYAVGLINAQDLLDMKRDSFSAVDINTVYRNGHFVLTKQTAAHVLSRHKDNADRNTVKMFLADFSEGRNILNMIDGVKEENPKLDEKVVFADKNIDVSMKLLTKADEKYRNKDYKGAIQLYNDAIRQDKDNMEAYSSLALAYRRLADQEGSIEYYKKCVQVVRDGNARMNANKSLLLDREIKAASYYNAGVAHEKMAKLYEKQGRQKEADKHYKDARNNYKTALENAEKIDMDASRKQVYKNAIKTVDKKINASVKSAKNKKRKLALNDGTDQVKLRKQILLYGKEYTGNSMA